MSIQEQWFTQGEAYARAVNEMVAFGEKEGWDNWKGPEPEDQREPLAAEVIRLLKEANATGTVAAFRKQFPPAHLPLHAFVQKQGQSIELLTFISGQKMLFFSGTSYEQRQAYLLDNGVVKALDASLEAAGRSMRNDVFAMAASDRIVTTHGWEGPAIHEFIRKETAGMGISRIIPFNDGTKVLLCSPCGIYLLSATEEKRIHPEAIEEEEEEDATNEIDMENVALSHDNRYIVAADQDSDHRVFDAGGNYLGHVGPQSSYPHFCLFAHDDSQLITNSCHFYNGITIGVDRGKLNDVAIEAYTESDDYIGIDEEMRVYAGVAAPGYYILGDAYGYIKAFDREGRKLWRHFLGSTISGMTISDDGQTLWVGTYAGVLHQLQLDHGLRDTHTIGNGNHYEDFRLLIWQEEPEILKW